jgi:effector-binding domain-containing protein
MTYRVELITVPEQAVLSLRGRGPLAGIGGRMRRLRELAAEARLRAEGPRSARFYEEDPDSPELDYEVCLPVAAAAGEPLPAAVAEARCLRLAAHSALETVHVGAHGDMDQAVRALQAGRAARGCCAAGPLTEIYEVGAAAGVPESRFVTRLRLPCEA